MPLIRTLSYIEAAFARQAARDYDEGLAAVVARFASECADRHPGSERLAAMADRLVAIASAMTRPPRVLVMGEFNSGKTTLCNLLLRQRLLQSDFLSNTRKPVVLRRTGLARKRPFASRAPFEHDVVEVDSARLARFDLVDTPGVSDPANAAYVLEPYARDADIALWCSVATQCWKESERACWSALPARLRRSALLVVTCADSIREPAQRQRLTERLEQVTQGLFSGLATVSAHAPGGAAADGRALFDGDGRASGVKDLEAKLRVLVERHVERRHAAGRRRIDRMAGQLARQAVPDRERWWVWPLVKWKSACEAEVERASLGIPAQSLLAEKIAAASAALVRDDLAPRLIAAGRHDDLAYLRALLDGVPLRIHSGDAGPIVEAHVAAERYLQAHAGECDLIGWLATALAELGEPYEAGAPAVPGAPMRFREMRPGPSLWLAPVPRHRFGVKRAVTTPGQN